jgi:hypothetical protein
LPVHPRFRSVTEDTFPSALLFIAFAGLAMCMPPHSDTWWHLRSGLEMVKTGGILTTETFSHTIFGIPLYLNHEWLSELIFYGLFRTGGPILLAAAGSACVIAAVAGAWRLLEGSGEAKFGWLLVLFLGTVTEWAVRPQVISLAFFVLAFHLVISPRNHARWLPVLCVIWANMHGLVIAGVIVAGCAVVEAVLWSRSRVRESLVIATACVAAPLCSPDGWHYWPRVLDVVQWSRVLQIQEYRSAFELAQLPFWIAVAVLVAVAARRGALTNADRSTRLLVLIAAVFALAGATSVRNIPLFVLAAIPAISRLLRSSKPRRAAKPAPAGVTIFLALAVIVVAVIVTYAWRAQGAYLGWTPMSTSAREAIRQCPGPMFNGFWEGGFLEWFVPERRVFIDSRVHVYPLDLLQKSHDADLTGHYDGVFREFHIGCAVVTAGSPMARHLAADPAMRQLYSDGQWHVFEVQQGPQGHRQAR